MNFNPILFTHLLSCFVSGTGRQKLSIFIKIISFADLWSYSPYLLDYSRVHRLEHRFIVIPKRKITVEQSFFELIRQTCAFLSKRLGNAENYAHMNDLMKN